MKTLIVEDEYSSRLFLEEALKRYGTVDVAVNGKESVEAVRDALLAGAPYDLVCMDIMMPELDGNEAVKQIRALEAKTGRVSSEGARILMTTALGDMKNLMAAFGNLCDGYLTKPIKLESLQKELASLGLISE